METHIYMYEITHKFIKHLSNKIIKLIPECFNLCPAEILSQINLCGRACLMRWIPTASPSHYDNQKCLQVKCLFVKCALGVRIA